jgi:hypothetical protein
LLPLLLLLSAGAGSGWWLWEVPQHYPTEPWLPAAVISAATNTQQVSINVHCVCLAKHPLQHLDVAAGICQRRVQLMTSVCTSSSSSRSSRSSSNSSSSSG